LNTVRKHLSAIKGGWLATRAGGRVRTLVISDVVGDDVSVIASGPTVPDASTFGEARSLVERYGGAAAYPSAVVAHLDRGARGEIAETPKPAFPSRVMSVRVIGRRRHAMLGAGGRAGSLGYHVHVVEEAVVGEAREAAAAHVPTAVAIASKVGRPACVVSSGETTVTVRGAGKGGRNQEFALAAAISLGGDGVRSVPGPSPIDQQLHLADRSSASKPSGDGPDSVPGPSPVLLASIGTDGIDGPTDAAGAIADTTTIDRARAAGLDPTAFLLDNNAYAFFDALGDLVLTGPTGTNVGDLQVVLLP
jgi:hydroxypyruvate reductase